MTPATLPSAHGEASAWRRFLVLAGTVTALAIALLYGFILLLDPFGRYTSATRAPAPLMDVNQRYMYPQLTRSGLFDAAVFGTSTLRLLDPAALGEALGARFANLAINAGTPFEQLELAHLFLRHVETPRVIVLGLDRNWCDPAADAPENKLTFRSFPPWLYDENPWNDLPHLLSAKALEIAGRVALNRLGRMRDRIRRDGYEVFTPPEASYDLARARAHLGPPGRDTQSPPAGSRLPAIAWLAAFAGEVPAATRLVAVLPPVHVAAQARVGSPGAAADEACKAAIVRALAPHRDAVILDYRRPTALTSEDSNYWDPLHYRLPIAGRIVSDIRDALAGGGDAADGRYRVLAAPRRS